MPRSVDTDVAVQPDGRILFTEVDLSEGVGTSAPKENRVNWIEQGGAFIAEYMGGSIGNDGTGINRYLRIASTDESGSKAELDLIAKGTGATPTGVYASANAPVVNSATLLTGEGGTSDWLQCVGQPFTFPKRRIIEGPFLGNPINPAQWAIASPGSFTLGIGYTTTCVIVGGFFDGPGWSSMYTWGWSFSDVFHFVIYGATSYPGGTGGPVSWAGYAIHD